jgi:hypothetical protein
MNSIDEKYIPVLDSIRALCYKQGTILDLVDAPYVEFYEGCHSNGYFDTEANRIAVALQAPNWFLVLIHEFSHSRQMIEQCPAWKKYDSFEGEDYLQCWIDGDYMPPGFIDKVITATRDMELDCEQRSYRLLVGSGAGGLAGCIEYGQKAMSYVLFYEHIRKYRMWYTLGCEPYNVEAVWNNAPGIDKFNWNHEHLLQEYARMEPLYLKHLTVSQRAA